MEIAGYEFADGAHFQNGADKTDPATIALHLDMLRQRSAGHLTPDDVVADARSGNSPLHSFFEWNDGAAAHQHRLAQARGLIRAVVAVYKADEKQPVKQRAYVHIPETKAPHYMDAKDAMSQPTTRDMVLRRAWSELHQWKRRYIDLSEFADLVAQIDRLEEPPKPKAG